MDEIFSENMALASVSLGHVETAAALARQRATRKLDGEKLGKLEEQLDREWDDFLQLDVTRAVVERAVQLTRAYGLRGADAVHLAAAMELKERLEGIGDHIEFVSSDLELLEAARRVGLKVENPVSYRAS